MSYQLNLFSLNNFHNCIRLTHLLHPLTPSPTVPRRSLLPSKGTSSTCSSEWHCRSCAARMTTAAPLLSLFYLCSQPNRSELSPNWTFSLFSPYTNCPRPPFPPPFYSSRPSPPPRSKCLVNKLNSNCCQFNC